MAKLIFPQCLVENGRDSNRTQNVTKIYLNGINKNVHLRGKWSGVDYETPLSRFVVDVSGR